MTKAYATKEKENNKAERKTRRSKAAVKRSTEQERIQKEAKISATAVLKVLNTTIKPGLIRAIKAVAQTAIATIGTSAVLSAVDWKFVLSASALAGIISVLTSIAGLPESGAKSSAKAR